MVTAEVALNTARALLNDQGGSLWTDPVLIPLLQQAHKEMQTKLRVANVPVMKNVEFKNVNAGTLTYVPNDANFVEPIQLWEKNQGDPDTAYIPMTESDPLPIVAQVIPLSYWQWLDEVITFLGATGNRTVRVRYWRQLPLPAIGTDSLGFTGAELYIAPRTAALAAGSVGNKSVFEAATTLAMQSISDVIQVNRGRMTVVSKA